jgi:6-phosphogluconate dehydrogenase
MKIGLLASLPDYAIIMVQAGKGTNAVISQLAERFEPGDIIVDGGNALSPTRFVAKKKRRGISFVGAEEFSGGEEGAPKGPKHHAGRHRRSLLNPSGQSWLRLPPWPKVNICQPVVARDRARHFIEMIHNGIEYADMQLIAEAYDILRQAGGYAPAEIAGIFEEWNKGDLGIKFLIEITAEVLKQVDAKTGKPLVDVILGQAGSKGTGVWTVQTALNLGTPVFRHCRELLLLVRFRRRLASAPRFRAYRLMQPPGKLPTKLLSRSETFNTRASCI